MNALQTAAITIIASLLTSGLVAAVVTHALSDWKERRNLMREKAQELYLCLYEYEITLGTTYIKHMPVIKGEMGYAEFYEWMKEAPLGDRSTFARLQMLTDIYFPSAKPAFDRLISVRTAINAVAGAHQKASKGGSLDPAAWWKRFNDAMDDLTPAFEEYRSQVIAAARKYI